MNKSEANCYRDINHAQAKGTSLILSPKSAPFIGETNFTRTHTPPRPGMTERMDGNQGSAGLYPADLHHLVVQRDFRGAGVMPGAGLAPQS